MKLLEHFPSQGRVGELECLQDWLIVNIHGAAGPEIYLFWSTWQTGSAGIKMDVLTILRVSNIGHDINTTSLMNKININSGDCLE